MNYHPQTMAFSRPSFRRMLRPLAITSVFVLSCCGLFAAPPAGRLLASQCFQCHGTNGQAVGGFESVSGKNANEMFNELREMSQRRPESIMDLQARAFTPDQLRLIANYLATLPKGTDEEERDDED